VRSSLASLASCALTGLGFCRRYEKYTKTGNEERLLNPGDAFQEATMDFQAQITLLKQARRSLKRAPAHLLTPRPALRRG